MATTAVTFTRRYIDANGVAYRPGDTDNIDSSRVERLVNIGVIEGNPVTVWTDRKNAPAKSARRDLWVAFAELIAPGEDHSETAKADLVKRFGEPVV